jgi:aminoglycoside phosphotransferase (APT) family kinase protein
MSTAVPGEVLPEGLAAQVEDACGATITSVKPRGGGGASRQGAELTLRYPDGREQRAYMSYDTQKGGASEDGEFLREAAVLRALSGPLRSVGARAAGYIADIPESRALISEFVVGEADFNRLKSPQDRRAVAGDFMAQLARLHSFDPREQPIAGFGELVPPSKTIRESVATWRARQLTMCPHPLLMLAFDWLEQHVPPDPERIVVVHGDAGPANFLYQDNQVTALLDWELVHYGDPMEDLAMLCLRNLFQPFIPLPEAFAQYEAAGGVKVDLGRVRYYRLFYQARFAGSVSRLNDPVAPDPPVYGMTLVYVTAHIRVLNEALAEAAGVDLPPLTLPEQPPSAHQHSFEVALKDLRDVIVPRLADQQATSKAKGLARLVKWWRDIERFGPTFAAIECAEYSKVLNRTLTSAHQARQALCHAILAHEIDLKAAILLCHLSTYLDRALLADAMGAIAAARFAPLE